MSDSDNYDALKEAPTLDGTELVAIQSHKKKNKKALIDVGQFVVGGPYKDTFYDDLRVPLTQIGLGVVPKPDLDETNVGLLFPQNLASEQALFIAQMPHNWAEGTMIYPHIHWQDAAGTAVTWKLDYKIFNPNTSVPAAFTTVSGSTGVFPWTSGNLSQITRLGAGIDMTGIGLSALMLCKIYRDDNVTTGDVLGWEVDFHYEIDSIGSNEEFIK